jgi:hypothetical protein
MYEPNNHLSNEFLGNISHFSELSATCQTIPDLTECNYINEIGFDPVPFHGISVA